MVPLRLEDYYRAPGGAAAVQRIEDGLVLSATGERVGTVHDRQRRFEWRYTGSAALAERIASEKAVWDGWADAEAPLALRPLDPGSRPRDWWDYPLYEDRGVARTIAETAELRHLKGLRILDLGGTVKDSWRFVWHGDAARVEHVDVSGESQLLGYRKLQVRFSDCPELLERFVFHTAAAEALPFAEGSFDLVFSRATIHHTSRNEAFAEIARVLRPNGLFWMIEPRLSAPVYALMKLSRWIRRADRGTDDPLREFELRRLARLMPVERVYGVNPLPAYPALGKSALRLVQTIAGLGRFKISLVARKAGAGSAQREIIETSRVILK